MTTRSTVASPYGARSVPFIAVGGTSLQWGASRTACDVAIARALVVDPILVLADEPTGNRDTETSSHVIDLLYSFDERYGTAFLIVTHEREIDDHRRRTLHLQMTSKRMFEEFGLYRSGEDHRRGL